MSLPASLIRRLARKQSPTTISVTRPTDSLDASRTPKRTFAAVATGIKALVSIRSGAEAIRYGRENNRRFGLVLCPPGTDIRVQDRIVHGANTYDVQVVRTPHSRISTDSLAYLVAEVEQTS